MPDVDTPKRRPARLGRRYRPRDSRIVRCPVCGGWTLPPYPHRCVLPRESR